MLVIPVGLENSEVRRRPWVSLAITGLVVAAFLLLGPPEWGGDWSDRVEARARAVEDYLLEHPYLAVAPDIEPLLSDGVRAELSRRRAYGSGSGTGLLSFVVDGQGHELKTLENGVRAGLEEAPAWRYGFVPARSNVFDAITSMFLHGGWLHVIGNLLFFFAMGPFLEDVYGRVLFTLLYFSAGVAAAYVHAANFPASHAPLIGASGAIAGVMGAFLIRLGTSRIRFLFLPIVLLPFIRVPFRVRAAIVLPLWFAEQALLATEAPDTQGGVAVWAHIGGFAFGAAAAALIRLARIEERWVDPKINQQISWQQHPALTRASQVRFENAGAAEKELSAVLRDQPDDLDALRMAYDVAMESGDRTEAIRRADRLFSVYVRRGESQLARELVFDAMRKARESFPARFALAAARFLEREGETNDALALDEDVASRFPDDPAALLALVRIAAIKRGFGDEAAVARTLERARRHLRFSPEWEAALLVGDQPRGRG